MPHTPPLRAPSHCILTPHLESKKYNTTLVPPRFPYYFLITQFGQRPDTSVNLPFHSQARFLSSHNMPGRPRAGERTPQSREVTISKDLSYVLRHGAEKEGLRIDDGGWTNVSDVVSSCTISMHIVLLFSSCSICIVQAFPCVLKKEP